MALRVRAARQRGGRVMSYLLRFDGVDDYVSIANPVNVNIGLDTWTFEVEAAFTATTGSGGCVLGNASSTGNDGFQLLSTGRLNVLRNGVNAITCNAGFVIFDSTSRIYRLEHDSSGAFRYYRDGILTQSGTYTTSGSFANSLGLIGKYRLNVNWLVGMDFRRISLSGFSDNQVWDANLSGGSGSTLPTVSGTNQGTLVNFTVPDCWVFYDAGGGDVAASIAATMPQMSISTSASVVNPEIAASVDFNMPQMQVASSGNVVAPGISASIALTMPQMSVAASADNIAPTIAASVALTMPQMQVAVSGNVLGVGNSASVSFAMPQMIVAASGSQTVPVISATIATTMPQMAIVTAADVIGVAGVAASISLTMPQMAVSTSAEKTTPVISASISFAMPQMSAYALSGEFDYFSGEGSHIEYLALSSHIETVAASTHIEYTL